MKREKEQKCRLKLFQDFRRLLKTFSIHALTESFCNTVAIDEQLMNFLFEEKIMLSFPYI